MINTDNEKEIFNWIKEVSTKKSELGGFSICPYAFMSKTKIIETCNFNLIEPNSNYDVVIFILDVRLEVDQIKENIVKLNNKYPKYLFLGDFHSIDTYIGKVKTNNSKFNLILCQNKKKLTKFREKLLDTNYYSYWDENYLKEILGNDYSLITEK